jgi:nicotinate-nucleotide pyrophosphorylase (carboxylating)
VARRGESIADLVARALAEDVGKGDATSTALIGAETRARARISQKQPGAVFGLEPARQAFAQAGADRFEARIREGQLHESVPAEVARIEGPARAILTAERTALNFLCHLSGIATLTARFVAAVRGTGVEVLDTRKTTPGLRALEKAAVAAGGGANHRFGLDDAILIKENHIAVAGGLGRAVAAARAARPELSVEVECRTLGEVDEAFAAGAARLLLDNMSPDELRRAAAARDRSGRAATLEASGGVTLSSVGAIAASGVDQISIGALTHSAPALDLSLLVEPA